MLCSFFFERGTATLHETYSEARRKSWPLAAIAVEDGLRMRCERLGECGSLKAPLKGDDMAVRALRWLSHSARLPGSVKRQLKYGVASLEKVAENERSNYATAVMS